MLHDPIVVLTATIEVPPQVAGLLLRDRQIRLAHYTHALRQWLSLPAPLNLVFIENSGCDLTEILECVHAANRGRHQVEVISCDGRTASRLYGKGAGELQMLRHAFNTSALLQQANGPIFKVTGRLFVANVARLIETCSSDIFVYCDMRKHLTWATSSFFSGQKRFFENYLLPMEGKIDERQGVCFEHVLAKAVLHAISDGSAWRLFPVLPRLRGISASTGQRYDHAYPMHLLRCVLHRYRRRIFGRS